jgi:hypothetical protein
MDGGCGCARLYIYTHVVVCPNTILRRAGGGTRIKMYAGSVRVFLCLCLFLFFGSRSFFTARSDPVFFVFVAADIAFLIGRLPPPSRHYVHVSLEPLASLTLSLCLPAMEWNGMARTQKNNKAKSPRPRRGSVGRSGQEEDLPGPIGPVEPEPAADGIGRVRLRPCCPVRRCRVSKSPPVRVDFRRCFFSVLYCTAASGPGHVYPHPARTGLRCTVGVGCCPARRTKSGTLALHIHSTP